MVPAPFVISQGARSTIRSFVLIEGKSAQKVVNFGYQPK
jgi:hypothetical protein